MKLEGMGDNYPAYAFGSWIFLRNEWYQSTDILINEQYVCVAGQQRMLTPPRHLILSSHFSGVRVAQHSIL
jgi:hypothetical protein